MYQGLIGTTPTVLGFLGKRQKMFGNDTLMYDQFTLARLAGDLTMI
jgi:hypothetical protein